MIYDYSFGGLRITSDIALPGLRELSSHVEDLPRLRLTAEVGPAIRPDRLCHAWNHSYRLRLGEYSGRWLVQSRFDGSFLIERDGTALHLIARALPPASEVIEVLLRRVLPRVPVLAGAIAIHAASLAYAGAGILLVGRSGAGKSTLTGALATRGWQVLGDDISVLWNRSAPALGAGANGVCLWPASRVGLGIPLDQAEPLVTSREKARYSIPGERAPTLVPLRALFFLDRSASVDVPRLERLGPVEAMSSVLPEIVRFNPRGESAKERVDAVLGMRETLFACAAWRLVYPDGFAALPQVEGRLRALLSDPHADCAAMLA